MSDRILREDICISEELNSLSPEAEVFFYRLAVQCDDLGQINNHVNIIRPRCFPLRTDTVRASQLATWLHELMEVGLIVEDREGDYFQLTELAYTLTFPTHRDWDRVRLKLTPIVLERDGYKCRKCGAQAKLTVDHVIPLSKRGTNTLDNLQTLCQSCNSRKGAKAE